MKFFLKLTVPNIHQIEVPWDCTQFKLRYMRDDGSYSPWDTSLPDFRDQAKMATACHIYFSAQDFN